MATLICDLGGVLFAETDPRLRVETRRSGDGAVPAARTGDEALPDVVTDVVPQAAPGDEPADQPAVNVDVLATLSRLRERGWQLIGATDSVAWDDPAVRTQYAWVLALFDRLITSADVRASRPDPRYFAELRSVCKHGARLYVDDDPHNVAAARRAGFDAHVFTTAAALDSACRHLAVAVG